MLLHTAQKIYNFKLYNQNKTLIDRLKARLIDILFNRFKSQNLLVETSIGKFKLKLPFSHQLPFILKASPYYSTNLARIASHVHQKYSDLKFIDIGANIGDSVALLRSEAKFPILCIEGDQYFFSILQDNTAKFLDVHIAQTYVGEVTEEVKATSVELGGTAHLSQEGLINSVVRMKKLSDILDDIPLFRNAKMVKIDTDGFDNKIIRGSVDFLSSIKPIVFFEYDPFFLAQQNEDYMSVFSTLSVQGYEKILIYENYGELMLSADLNDNRLLEDITHFYSGRKGLTYCDICAFHKDDIDLFNSIRISEMKFFKQVRG